MSNKGHAIMHWPYGGTHAIARYVDGRRSLENSRAGLARVERLNPPPAQDNDKDNEVTQEATDEYVIQPWYKANGKRSWAVLVNTVTNQYLCAICHRASDSPAGTSRHATKTHGLDAVEALKPQPKPELVVEPEPKPEPEVKPESESALAPALLDLLRSELVDDLARERAKNRELLDSLTAVRDLLSELIGEDQ